MKKIKWSRIYKRYLNKAKGVSIKDTNLNAFNEMMHDYWIGAIPGVPSGRYGEAPHDESFRQLLAEFYILQLAAHVVDDEPEEPRQICDMWLSFWAVIFCVSFAFEIVSLYTRNRIFVLVCLSVMLFSLAMCTFLRIKKAEVK